MLTYNRQGGGSSFALGDGASQAKHRFGTGSGRESLNVFGENRLRCPGSRRGAALRVDLRGMWGRGSARNDDPSPSLVGAERSRVGIGLGLGILARRMTTREREGG